MDPYMFALLTLLLIALYTFAWRTLNVVRDVRKTALVSQAELVVRKAQIEAEVAAKKSAWGRSLQSRRKRDPEPEPESEEESSEELPAALVSFAEGLGIDPQKVLAGDPSELAKVQGLLGRGGSAPSTAHLM